MGRFAFPGELPSGSGVRPLTHEKQNAPKYEYAGFCNDSHVSCKNMASKYELLQ